MESGTVVELIDDGLQALIGVAAIARIQDGDMQQCARSQFCRTAHAAQHLASSRNVLGTILLEAEIGATADHQTVGQAGCGADMHVVGARRGGDELRNRLIDIARIGNALDNQIAAGVVKGEVESCLAGGVRARDGQTGRLAGGQTETVPVRAAGNVPEHRQTVGSRGQCDRGAIDIFRRSLAVVAGATPSFAPDLGVQQQLGVVVAGTGEAADPQRICAGGRHVDILQKDGLAGAGTGRAEHGAVRRDQLHLCLQSGDRRRHAHTGLLAGGEIHRVVVHVARAVQAAAAGRVIDQGALRSDGGQGGQRRGAGGIDPEIDYVIIAAKTVGIAIQQVALQIAEAAGAGRQAQPVIAFRQVLVVQGQRAGGRIVGKAVAVRTRRVEQDTGRNGTLAAAGRCPGNVDMGATVVLEVQHLDVVVARAQGHAAASLRRAMITVVVHHQIAVDIELAAVIAVGVEAVGAGAIDTDTTSPACRVGVIEAQPTHAVAVTEIDPVVCTRIGRRGGEVHIGHGIDVVAHRPVLTFQTIGGNRDDGAGVGVGQRDAIEIQPGRRQFFAESGGVGQISRHDDGAVADAAADDGGRRVVDVGSAAQHVENIGTFAIVGVRYAHRESAALRRRVVDTDVMSVRGTHVVVRLGNRVAGGVEQRQFQVQRVVRLTSRVARCGGLNGEMVTGIGDEGVTVGLDPCPFDGLLQQLVSIAGTQPRPISAVVISIGQPEVDGTSAFQLGRGRHRGGTDLSENGRPRIHQRCGHRILHIIGAGAVVPDREAADAIDDRAVAHRRHSSIVCISTPVPARRIHRHHSIELATGDRIHGTRFAQGPASGDEAAAMLHIAIQHRHDAVQLGDVV